MESSGRQQLGQVLPWARPLYRALVLRHDATADVWRVYYEQFGSPARRLDNWPTARDPWSLIEIVKRPRDMRQPGGWRGWPIIIDIPAIVGPGRAA